MVQSNVQRRQAVLAAAVVGLMGVYAAPSKAATYTWTGLASPDTAWSTANNWSDGTTATAPVAVGSGTGTAQIAVNLSTAGATTIDYTAGTNTIFAALGTVAVPIRNTNAAGSITLNFNSGNFTANQGTNGSYIGQNTTMNVYAGTLTMYKGFSLTGPAGMGATANIAAGTLNVISSTSSFDIGYAGNYGTMNVSGTGFLTTAIQQAGDKYAGGIRVGSAYNGNATSAYGVLDVKDTGSVSSKGALLVGMIDASPAGQGATAAPSGLVTLESANAAAWTQQGDIVLGFNNSNSAASVALRPAGELDIKSGTFLITGTSVLPAGYSSKVYVGGSSATGTLKVSGGSLGDATHHVNGILVGSTYDWNKATLPTSGTSTSGVGTNAASQSVVGTGQMTISGTGQVYANALTVGADPANTVTITGGTASLGDATFGTGSSLSLLIGGSQTVTFGNLTLNSNPLTFTGTADGVTNYTLATYTGTLSGTFTTSSLPAGYQVDYGTVTPGAITLDVVPEPASLGLAMLGASLLGMRRRRR